MAPSTYQSLKIGALGSLGVSKDAAHVYVGLIVFLGTAAIFRRSIRAWLPWCAVLGVALFAEALDARDDISELGRWRVWASMHDVVNTLFWPTVLFFLARFSRLLTR